MDEKEKMAAKLEELISQYAALGCEAETNIAVAGLPRDAIKEDSLPKGTHYVSIKLMRGMLKAMREEIDRDWHKFNNMELRMAREHSRRRSGKKAGKKEDEEGNPGEEV